MIEGTPVEDGVKTLIPRKFLASTSKVRIVAIAFSMAAIMLFVSLQGWIFDEVVHGIKDEQETYDRVPVWERSEWPYS